MMIAGIFIRNIKTYQGINYIPLTDSPNLNGILGNNGIGKSSILEAIDVIFNSRNWTLNTVVKKSGLEKTKPYIVPFFILEENFFNEETLHYARFLDKVTRDITADDATNPQIKAILNDFITHRDRILDRHDMEGKLLFPIGETYEGSISISVIEGKLFKKHLEDYKILTGSAEEEEEEDDDESELEEFKKLFIYICNYLEYLYIPKEIDPESFTKLESMGTQVLMGESLYEILDTIVGDAKVTEINQGLHAFLEKISTTLVEYTYRTPTDRQKRIQKKEIYNLIIQAFFNVRKLNKIQSEGNYLEINNLSSGEKQKAIIHVAHALITKHRKTGSHLIIAIDEPESSLHISACFEQFSALAELSEGCRQLLFTSHWYGFLPTLDKGTVTIITKQNSDHNFDMINLNSYREEIKQLITRSKGKLPFDIRVKSINDFIQSIITSATGENPYSWIICEGTSEKIYLSAYFSDLILKNKLRIVPVGGAKEVKKIYTYLAACYKDFEDELTGVIFLLSDTDKSQVRYEIGKHERFYCKRFVHDEAKNRAVLVNIDSNPVSPETEIEHVLNGDVFYQTLLYFSQEDESLNFLKALPSPEKQSESFSALDIRPSEKKAINDFIDKDNNKFKFAQKYIELMKATDHTPEWIKEIRNYLKID